MRWLVLAIVLGGVHSASAAPQRVCFAGNEVVTTGGDIDTSEVVETREFDTAAAEIRSHVWRAVDPDRDVAVVNKVDVKAATFDFVDPTSGQPGHGSLIGPAWKWTAYHSEVQVMPTIKLVSDAKLIGDGWIVDATAVGADPARTAHVAMKQFDCSGLAQRRKALDQRSPNAVHRCFAGALTSFKGKLHMTEPAVFEQIIDDDRHVIELRLRQGARPDAITWLHVDHGGITVNNANGTHGAGSIVGGPGAWVEYAWQSHGNPPVRSTGTLGGTHVSQIATLDRVGDAFTMLFDADAFDCKELAARKAALATKPK